MLCVVTKSVRRFTKIQVFVQDCQNHNPLIRALTIRTMSYIPLPSVFHALVDPLRHSLKDADPYVRKTAAICVAKLYFADPRLVERERFVESLRELLKDANPTVIANAVAALSEIADRSENIVFKLSFSMASKLVAALPECSECVRPSSDDVGSQHSPHRSVLIFSVEDGVKYISSTRC